MILEVHESRVEEPPAANVLAANLLITVKLSIRVEFPIVFKRIESPALKSRERFGSRSAQNSMTLFCLGCNELAALDGINPDEINFLL